MRSHYYIELPITPDVTNVIMQDIKVSQCSLGSSSVYMSSTYESNVVNENTNMKATPSKDTNINYLAFYEMALNTFANKSSLDIKSSKCNEK